MRKNFGTAGFVAHHEFCRSVYTRTRHGYGVREYGYGMGKPDLRVTRIKPYLGLVHVWLNLTGPYYKYMQSGL